MTQVLLYVQGGALKSADAWASFQTTRMQREADPEYQCFDKAPQMTVAGRQGRDPQLYPTSACIHLLRWLWKITKESKREGKKHMGKFFTL